MLVGYVGGLYWLIKLVDCVGRLCGWIMLVD